MSTLKSLAFVVLWILILLAGSTVDVHAATISARYPLIRPPCVPAPCQAWCLPPCEIVVPFR